MINPYAHSANAINPHHQCSPGRTSHQSSSRGYTTNVVPESNSSGGDGSQSLVGSTRVSSQHQQFRCLYTKHKTQKRKVWQDGRLVVTDAGRRAKLFEAQPRAGSTDPVLDECEIIGSSSLEQQLETEQFYIQIEGPWTDEPVSTTTTTTTATTSLPSLSIRTPTLPSKGMQRVLGSKFQKPNRYIPPPPHQRPPPKVQAVLSHRKRPLQPGEWERLHDSRRTTTSTTPGNNCHGGGGGGGFRMMEQQYQQALPNTVARPSMDPPPSDGISHGFRDGSRGDPRQRPTQTGEVDPAWEQQHHSDRTNPQPPVHYSNESGPVPFRLGENDQRLPQVPLPKENTSRQSHDDYNSLPQNIPMPPNNRTMAQHGVHSQSSHAQPVQSRRLGSMRFVNNEFTENRYYGLEEEEEDIEEGREWFGVPPTDPSYKGRTISEQHEPVRFSLVGQSTLGESEDNEVDPNTGDDPFVGGLNGPPPVPLAFPTPSAETPPRPTRTNHELMALFGAAPAVVLEDKENTKDAPATAVATLTPAKPLAEDSSLMQFRLPSPSSNASSSDCED